MKVKIVLAIILWIGIVIFFTDATDGNNSVSGYISQNTQNGNKLFLLGSVGNGPYNDYNGYAEANLNLWHQYSSYYKNPPGSNYLYPSGWNSLDLISNDIRVYQQSIIDKMDLNASYNLYSYLMRPKIDYLCYGQHSVYECERGCDESVNMSEDEWFYSYNTHETGNPITDGTREVVFCSLNNSDDPAGYVVKDLKTNRELCNRIVTNLTQDNVYDWYIMPAIKVPQNIDNQTRVCKIEVIGWEGNLVKTVELKGENFKVNDNYSGDYIEEFNFTLDNPVYAPIIISASEANGFNPQEKGWWKVEENSQFDIRVEWYKETDMWIDYVKVENKMGYELLRHQHDNWIQEEANAFGTYSAGLPYKFYVEEVEYNNLPCIKYINSKLSAYNQSVLCVPYLYVPPMNGGVWYDFELSKKASIYSDVGITEIFTSYYPLPANKFGIYNYGKPSYVPNTFAGYSYDMTQGKLGYPVQPALYEENLQSLLDDTRLFDLKSSQQLSKSSGKPFNFMVQAHSWLNFAKLNQEDSIYSLREPTNEEIEMMVCMGLTYGAKGIIYFSYNSGGSYIPDNGQYSYTKGLLENNVPDITKRTINVYGENKWAKIVSMNQKLKIWEPFLINFNDINTESFRYHIESERINLTQNTFLKDLKSFPTGNPANCPETDFDYNIPDLENQTYLQTGIFKNTDEPLNTYLMLVNRRCAPGNDACSGKRKIKSLIFSDTYFNGFNNWKIINLYDNSVIAVFDKRQANNIDFGWFEPGEGKLFKLAPVMQEGGTFVCDEEVLGQTFVCKADVSTSHYNLEINNSHIEFLSSVSIQAGISGGYDNELSISNTQLNGKNSVNWHGISGNYLYSVYLSNIQVSDIEGWAVNLSNCDVLYLQSSTFNLNNTNSGAVALNNSIGAPIAFIWNNIFVTKSFTAAIAIFNSSGSEDYVTIYNNNISTVENGNNGIIITNSSGEIEYNTITGFSTGINLLSCAFDVKGNNLTSSRNDSKGINATALSTLNLSTIGNAVLGGYNKISNTGTNCVNIDVDNSSFASDIGYNEFNVNNIDGNYNFFGTGVFPASEGFGVNEIPSRYNCFNGVNGTPRCSLRVPTRPIYYTVIGNPYYCNAEQNEDMLFTVQIAENFIDTVFRAPDSLEAKLTERQKLYKGVLINFRKHQYDSVSTKGNYYLSNYTDSVVAPDIISKLFYSASALDTAGERIQPLKTYFEQLIINNPDNPRLVKSAYYHIQKCKVYLEQYQSALAGFEDIIAQNPYGYEGLLASWDYAATLLLMDTIGAGGMSNKSELNEYLSETSMADYTVDSLRSKRLTKYDNYDKSVFTPNDRKTIIQNTATIFAEQRNKQIEKVKELEMKVSKSDGVDATRNKSELASMKALNEVVKIKRAKDQPDYMRLVTDDVNKVFKNTSDAGSNKTNVIPTSFELHQNYPNPFNPSTKIAFDLPKDAKVKLVIYDILGREIKTLIHNEFRAAGKYITEFNGSNLASGVYFYQLTINNEQLAIKKMLMIK
ncbi:MAG: T9SS type A sorting domain-containing protein [Ignavibacteria bacterium]